MDILICFCWRLKLDYEVDCREIKPTSGHISSNQTICFSTFKLSEYIFSHILLKVTMQHDWLNLKYPWSSNFLYLSFCLAKDDRLASFSFKKCIHNSIDITPLLALLELDAPMIYCLRCFYFLLFYHVYILNRLPLIHLRHLPNPIRKSRWEHKNLRLVFVAFSNVNKYFLYWLFKTNIKHLVCFVQTNWSQPRQINLSPIQHIDQSARSCYNNISTIRNLPYMFMDTYPSIYRNCN